MNYQISIEEHQKHIWIADDLLPDYTIEDVWQFPVELEENDTLQDFYQQFLNMNDRLMKKGLVAWLFRFRLFLGKLLAGIKTG